MNTTDRKIRLSKSVVGHEEAQALARVILEDGYLGMGQAVKIFETEIQSFLGTKRSVVSVNSGTAALHLALQACVLPGSEVLVQSLTFLASFQAISAAGAIPVPCEVLPESLTIDLEDAEKRLTEKTKAIMPVHYAGNPGDLDAIYRFAQNHGLRVIEDAAHAFGGIYQEKMVGSFGDVVCFSFDGIKNITSGEGGAVVTGDPKVVQYVEDARLLGIHRDTDKRFQGERSWEFDVTHQGYRYHMSNLFAAIGIVQLKRFNSEFKPMRQRLAKRYQAQLSPVKGIKLLHHNYDEIVPHIFPIRVDSRKRNGLRQFLLEHHIESGIHYQPNHLLTYYGNSKGELPITEQIYSELLTLPLHPDLTEGDQNYIIERVKNYFEG